jgi:HSP20 family protein
MNLVRIKKENDLLNDTFGTIFNHPLCGFRDELMNTSNFTPRARISEDKDNFYIHIEMPGIPKDDVKINLENNVLSISGTKLQKNKSEEANSIMNEIYYGEFCRSFNLSDDVKKDSIDAEFKDGMLHITLPKVEEAKPIVKEIKVK